MIFEELDIAAYLKNKHGRRHSYYAETVDHARDMGVHIHGHKPFKLLERVRPREDPEVKRYRLESYEPITTATADKGIVTVQKIMNPKLWTIKFPKGAEDIENYLFKQYPFYSNVMTYVNDVIIRAMLADPNGLICVVPLDMNLIDTQKVSPVATVIKSADLWDYEFGKWYLIHEKEEKDNDKKIDFFYWLDTTQVVRFKVITSPTKTETVIIGSYNHGIGEPPAWFLSGLIVTFEYAQVLYRSFFSAATPHWNKAVTSDSDLDGAFVNHMHPIRVELTEDCDFQLKDMRCVGGKINYADGKAMDCPGCHGTGRKSVKSPYGVYQVQKPPLGEATSSIQPVSYVSIPTEPTQMLSDRVQAQLDKGLAALNMFFEIGADQSGIAKVLDRSELYDFLLTLSTTVFDTHINRLIKYSSAYYYLNSTADKAPVIQKPVNFDLLTIQEEAAAITAATTAGVDPMYLKFKQLNFMRKDLFGKTLELNIAEDALLLNPFSGQTPETVMGAFNVGLVNENDCVIYFNIEKLILQAYEQNPNFHALSYAEKQEVMEELAEAINETESAMPPPIPPTI
jgi:hypothetical protein